MAKLRACQEPKFIDKKVVWNGYPGFKTSWEENTLPYKTTLSHTRTLPEIQNQIETRPLLLTAVCQPTALSVISADDPRGGGAPQVHHAGAGSREEADQAPQSRVPANGTRARSIPQEGTTC